MSETEAKNIKVITIGFDQGEEVPHIKVALSTYDWHKLLKELEYLHSIYRNNDDAYDIWEKISSALSGTDKIIYGSKKHRMLQPELFAAAKARAEIKEKEQPIKKKTLYERIFGVKE
jgi:hypothetical protein